MLAISSFYAFEKETSVQSEMHFGQCQGQTTLLRIEIVRMCVKIECDCKIVSKDNIDFYLLFEVFKAFFSHSNGIHSPVIVFNLLFFATPYCECEILIFVCWWFIQLLDIVFIYPFIVRTTAEWIHRTMWLVQRTYKYTSRCIHSTSQTTLVALNYVDTRCLIATKNLIYFRRYKSNQ